MLVALKTALFNCCCKDSRGSRADWGGGMKEQRGWGKLASPKLLFLKFACLLNSSIYKSYWILVWPSQFSFLLKAWWMRWWETNHLFQSFCHVQAPLWTPDLAHPSIWNPHIVRCIVWEVSKPWIPSEVGSQIPIRNTPGNTHLYLLNK